MKILTRKDLVEWYNITHEQMNMGSLWWFVQFVVSCKEAPAKVISTLAMGEQPDYEPDRQLLEQWAVAMYDFQGKPRQMRYAADLIHEELVSAIAPFHRLARSMVMEGLVERA